MNYELEKILVVDDELDIGLLMKAMLTSEGYKVLYAKNLTEANAFLNEEKISVVFLDLNLGNEYGLNLVPDINKVSENVNIVIITAQKEPSLKGIVAENGISRFIEKPFSKKEILTVLQNCA